VLPTNGANAAARGPQVPRRAADPIAALTTDGQDRDTVKQAYTRASAILTEGENIEYVAVARGGLGHAPDCAVATNKRLMLYRKKVLGKVELDDCYWRDLDSITLTEVKGAINIRLNAIQGWQLPVENVPKAQAAHLHELAIRFSERLQSAAQSESREVAGTEASIVFSAAQSEHAVPAPSRPLSPPSTPLIRPLEIRKSVTGDIDPAALSEPLSAPTGPRSPGTGPTAGASGAYYIATPESVLQNILQASSFDGDVEAGVPTRPMKWSAAAFQAPALLEAQPVIVSEHDVTPDNVSATPDNPESPAEPAVPTDSVSNNSASGLHAGPDPWNRNSSAGAAPVDSKGHDTEPQLRITPPLTTLERIAVFSLPSGSLGHDNSRPLIDLDLPPLPIVDTGSHLIPRLPLATTHTTGSMADKGSDAQTDASAKQDGGSVDILRTLAEKISGHLEDTLSFNSSHLPTLGWSTNSTGVIADDASEAYITEHISVMLGGEDGSGPLSGAVSRDNTVPDPQLAEIHEQASEIQPQTAMVAKFDAEEEHAEPLAVAHDQPVVTVSVEEAQAQASATASSSAPNLNDDVIAIVGYADESLSDRESSSQGESASPGSGADDMGTDEDGFFNRGTSGNAHPTAPMGPSDHYLPVPGSLVGAMSGPLLPASNMDHAMEDVYNNASPMATQRLESDLQFDLGDRPTSVNLNMSSLPAKDQHNSDWGAPEAPSTHASRSLVDEQKKSKSPGSASPRTTGLKASADDPIAKMKQLKAMLDAGFITDEDYAAKKAEILSRI
jgi:hypothetical protein